LIVTCERCDTRFRLDESRLPARGARVRCSRCKHAFFVRPDGASPGAAIHEIAENAATMMRPATPDASWDLEEGADPGRTVQAPPRAAPVIAPEPPSDFDDESDWRFEDEVPQFGDSGASLDLPNGEAPPPEPVDPNESSLAQLGDPESWDLLSSSSNLAPLEPAQPEPPPPAAPVEREPAIARAAPAVERAPVTRPVVEPVAEPMLPVAVEHSLALRVAGWSATGLLGLWILLAGALPKPASGAAEASAVAIAPFELGKLHVRLVDNTWVGPLWVVRGELHNASREPHALDGRIAVELLDADGDAIEGAVATAQLPLAEQRLREEEPERFGEAASLGAAALARRVLAPGERVEIEAVFASAPRGAARFAIEKRALEPLPVAPPPRIEAPAEPVVAPTPLVAPEA
jgi:predicted Zn finger-like uncharacterized protein